MLSRMYTTTVVARSIRAMGASRYMATSTPSSNKTPESPKVGGGPQGPKSTPPSTPVHSSKGSISTESPMAMNALDSRGSNAHFAKARVNLPLRFYNKPGLLASRLYVEAEKSGKAEVDKVAAALTSLKNELAAHPKLAAYLTNAAKTPQQKSALFNNLATSLNLPPTLTRFLDYMAKNRTAKELTKVIANYQSLIMARDKVVDVTITLAQPDQPKPDNAEITKILNYSPDTTIRLKVVVDPSIEGGAILSSKDRFLDRSFRKAITAYKEKLELESQKKRAAKRAEFMKELAQFPGAIQP